MNSQRQKEKFAQSVLGPVAADDLGITLPHAVSYTHLRAHET